MAKARSKKEGKLHVFEEWRLTDEGGRAFVALEASADLQKCMRHMVSQVEDGVSVKQVDDPFFGTCFVATKDGEVLGRVRELTVLA